MTDLTAQIAALRRTLADATKECPCEGCNRTPEEQHQADCECKGTGRVARFSGFRQECAWCEGVGNRYGCDHANLGFGLEQVGNLCAMCKGIIRSFPCKDCNGTGRQVAAGGLHDAWAGLTSGEAQEVLEKLALQLEEMVPRPKDPMPSAPKILAKGLELVEEHHIGDVDELATQWDVKEAELE